MTTIAHISDLHFSSGAHVNTPHCHDIHLLLAAERAISAARPDYVLVTGDVTNRGDIDSFMRAYDWLTGRFTIGQGKSTGLSIPINKLIVIPGNHDAWNCLTNAPLISHGISAHRQKSLENYNSVFVNEHSMPTPPGCRYLWIEDRDISTYMVLADSSYFGELDPCEDSPAPLSKIARGKLSLQQTEQILLWYDKGMAGTLEDSANSGRQISSEAFSKSLKILVMHHYLFEPPEYTEDYFLKIRDRDLVFRNLALAGFDLLLCGHKHIAAPIKTSYHRHFDKRAMRRLALNHLRRCAGLPSAPLLRDQGGVWRQFAARVSKPIRWFADKLARARRSAAPLLAEGPPLENVLEAGLRDPTILRQYLNVVLAHQNRDSERVVEGRELMEICKSLDIRFSPQERKAIASVIAGYMNTLGNRLIRRPFVQLMSGSTTKASLDQHKDRHFNIYRISLSGDGFEFNVTEYDFNDEAMEFSPTIPTPYLFPYNRGLPLLSNTLEASADQISGSG